MLRRAQQAILQKTGRTEGTVDSEYDELLKQLYSLRKQTDDLAKACAGLRAHWRGVVMSGLELSTSMKDYYATNTADMAGSANGYRVYKGEYSRLVEQLMPKLDDAMKCLQSYSLDLNQYKKTIDQQKKARLDMDAQRRTVHNLASKPQKDPQKLPLAEEQMKIFENVYEDLTTSLKTDIPAALDRHQAFNDKFIQVVKSYAAAMTAVAAEAAKVKVYDVSGGSGGGGGLTARQAGSLAVAKSASAVASVKSAGAAAAGAVAGATGTRRRGPSAKGSRGSRGSRGRRRGGGSGRSGSSGRRAAAGASVATVSPPDNDWQDTGGSGDGGAGAQRSGSRRKKGGAPRSLQGEMVAHMAQDEKMQQQVGAKVSARAKDPAAQQAAADKVTAMSEDPAFQRKLGQQMGIKNPTAQKKMAGMVGKAAQNKTVQKQVGNHVAAKAEDPEFQKQVGKSIADNQT